MKIGIIYGSPRKGTTYNAIKIIKDELEQEGLMEFFEVMLPNDVPVFCKGCFSCFIKGEEYCPDSKYIQPIVNELKICDGIIIGSPVYAMQISGGLKAFFDHMAYFYLNHRPYFFKKKALVIITTAGAGIGNCRKYINQNLKFWGVNKVLSYGQPLWAASWDDIPFEKKEKLVKNLKKVSKQFYKEVESKKIHKPSFLQVVMYYAGKALMYKYDESSLDKKYWENNRWTTKECKYFIDEARPGIIKTLVGKLIFNIFKIMIKK